MNSTKEDKDLIGNLMKSRPQFFQSILDNLDRYEIQIIYTQIDRDSSNQPFFRTFHFNTDPNRYFYPASAVKMPVAFLALEKLNELNIDGVNKYTTMLTDSAYSGQTSVYSDPSTCSGLPNIAHYIKKIFLVSDNDAYNRLYEFLGQKWIYDRLRSSGYANSKIIHRLDVSLSKEENRHTNPIRFVDNNAVFYTQPAAYYRGPLLMEDKILKGRDFFRKGVLINKQMDFSHKNFIPLEEMHRMLKAVIFPEAIEEKHRFNLSDEDYAFLYQYMSQLPSETFYPSYDAIEYRDAYSKFLVFGNERGAIAKDIRMFNKIGQAYGFLIDNAYVTDFEKNIEFLLSAIILTNENEIFNDGQYEYDEVGFPFLKNLGQLIYDYEIGREKKYQPDLTKFMLGYDKVTRVSEKFHRNVYQNYKHYHIPQLDHKRITRSDIEPVIKNLSGIQGVEVVKLGESVEGREINMIRLGKGSRRVLLWSQMHGDESTATRALLEIVNFFTSEDILNPDRERILNELTLLFVPMLNPDGAEMHKRQNAIGIDLNRDALRLVSPEAQILKAVWDQYAPDFGFNLHDQSRYYNVGNSKNPACISFLAPAYSYEKEVNDVRGKAMKAIVAMNEVLQTYIPGKIGRYSDDFEPRAFGDNIQKWGTGTVLVESGGGFPNDPEKRQLVRMNFTSLLHAFDVIASKEYEQENLENYFEIPENDLKLFDLLIRNGEVLKHEKKYRIDIGIKIKDNGSSTNEKPCAWIEDVGDLSDFFGYDEFDASGLQVSTGKIYPLTLKDQHEIDDEKILGWLKKGYTTVRIHKELDDRVFSRWPIRVIGQDCYGQSEIAPGSVADLILSNGDEVIFAIIFGNLINLRE